MDSEQIRIPLHPHYVLEGILTVPNNAKGIVLFAHGSGSNRNSLRNQYVAQVINKSGIATALFDLLTQEEAIEDEKTRNKRFDIEFLFKRGIVITEWIMQYRKTRNLNFGYYGASTGAAAVLLAAAYFGGLIKAVVSRGGRVDLARAALKKLHPNVSILFLVGSNDPQIIDLTQRTMTTITQVKNKRLVIVQGAGHLFEEEGKIAEVANHAASWFESSLY